MGAMDVSGIIGAISALVAFVAKQLGESTDDVIKRVIADCKATAKDPKDETDKVSDAIDSDLPD